MIDDFEYDPNEPFNRLEFIDVCLEGHALSIERISEQLKEQSEQILQITKYLHPIAEAIQSLQQQNLNLDHRVTVLECKNETNPNRRLVR